MMEEVSNLLGKNTDFDSTLRQSLERFQDSFHYPKPPNSPQQIIFAPHKIGISITRRNNKLHEERNHHFQSSNFQRTYKNSTVTSSG
jgi:hypothetical protein